LLAAKNSAKQFAEIKNADAFTKESVEAGTGIGDF
jgi:hypothetical protein